MDEELELLARKAKELLIDYYYGAIYAGGFSFLNLEVSKVERLYKNHQYEELIEKAIEEGLLK